MLKLHGEACLVAVEQSKQNGAAQEGAGAHISCKITFRLEPSFSVCQVRANRDGACPFIEPLFGTEAGATCIYFKSIMTSALMVS
jgi:hypothetical protein